MKKNQSIKQKLSNEFNRTQKRTRRKKFSKIKIKLKRTQD